MPLSLNKTGIFCNSPKIQVGIKNQLRPIDALQFLQGLALNVILYFENPDEITFNRDDALYIK